MKIKMLKTRYDNGVCVWFANQLFDVEDNDNYFYTLITINGQKYGVDKSLEGKEFEIYEYR